MRHAGFKVIRGDRRRLIAFDGAIRRTFGATSGAPNPGCTNASIKKSEKRAQEPTPWIPARKGCLNQPWANDEVSGTSAT